MKLNDRGSGILIYLLGISLVSALFFASVQSYMINMENTKKSYQYFNEKRQLANELKVVFANQSLCNSLLHIQGRKFSVGSGSKPVLAPNMIYEKNLKIQDLRVENVETTSSKENRKKADFVVFYSRGNNKSVEKVLVTAGYKMNSSGGLSDCHLFIDSVIACEDAGGYWDSTLKFCDFCTRIGGTWVGDAPSSATPGYCLVVRN